MNKILSIDPGGIGGHTGVVVGSYDPSTPLKITFNEAIGGGFEGFYEWVHKDTHKRLFMPLNGSVVVCEHFSLRGHTADITPAFIEGGVRMLNPQTVLQNPSDAFGNKFITRADLSIWSAPFEKDHHKDQESALIHMLAFLVKRNHKPTVDYLAEHRKTVV
jgi:hypothetical protein